MINNVYRECKVEMAVQMMTGVGPDKLYRGVVSGRGTLRLDVLPPQPLLRSLVAFVSIPLEGLVAVWHSSDRICYLAAVVLFSAFRRGIWWLSYLGEPLRVLRHIRYCLQRLFFAPHEVSSALYRSNCALFVKAYLSRRITSTRDPTQSLPLLCPSLAFSPRCWIFHRDINLQ